MPALGAFERAFFIQGVDTPFDFDGFSQDDRFRDLAVGRDQNVPEGLPGNPHFLRGLFLIESFQIRKPNRFQFVHCQMNLFQQAEGNAPGLEVLNVRLLADATAF